jgi:hypothetical protein
LHNKEEILISKKRFNSAVSRLQNSLTSSHLFKMLSHQLHKSNTHDQYTDTIKQLEVLSEKFQDNHPLDRRRSEDYLSNALYGKSHSQISHLMLKDNKTISSIEIGKKARYYGIFLDNIAPYISNDPFAKILYDKLTSITYNDFNVSFQGYEKPIDTYGDDKLYKTVAYVSFSDFSFTYEFSYTQGSDKRVPFGNAEWCSFDVQIDGLNGDEYADKIMKETGVEYDGDRVRELLTEFLYEQVDNHHDFKDFYCTAIPKNVLDNHKYTRISSKKDTIVELLSYNITSLLMFEFREINFPFFNSSSDLEIVFSGFSLAPDNNPSEKEYQGSISISSQESELKINVVFDYNFVKEEGFPNLIYKSNLAIFANNENILSRKISVHNRYNCRISDFISNKIHYLSALSKM